MNKRSFGYSLILVGFLSLIIGTNIDLTGYAVANNISQVPENILITFSGLGMIIAGILVLSSGKEISDVVEKAEETTTGTEPMWQGAKGNLRESSKGSNVQKNKYAKHVMREMFKEEYGRYPENQEELKRYIRGYHESGELAEKISSRYDKRKRSHYH